MNQISTNFLFFLTFHHLLCVWSKFSVRFIFPFLDWCLQIKVIFSHKLIAVYFSFKSIICYRVIIVDTRKYTNKILCIDSIYSKRLVATRPSGEPLSS